jgi:hypothetical protein
MHEVLQRRRDGATPNHEKIIKTQKKYDSSKKVPNIRTRRTRQNLRVRPKIMKNYRNTKSTNRSEKNSPKKNMLSTSKAKRSQNCVYGLSYEICRLNPTLKRTDRITKSTTI